MTDRSLELTRRKMLASVGAVGTAGAVAGLGAGASSGLFSDGEQLEDNSFTAGTLDLKIGWDEHYFDGIRNLDNSYGGDVEFDSPEPAETGFPSSSGSPYLAVAEDAVDAFMDDTRTEQFPEGGLGPEEDPCEELADVPGEELPAPLIDLDDVKPGDFGEVTFCFSLCDNDGYLWMTGGITDENENPPIITDMPTDEPTAEPTDEPTAEPTPEPTDTPTSGYQYGDGETLVVNEQACDGPGGGENEAENENEDEGGSGGDYIYTYTYDYRYTKGDYKLDYRYEYEWSEDAKQDPNPPAPTVDESLPCSEDGAGIGPNPDPSPSPP